MQLWVTRCLAALPRNLLFILDEEFAVTQIDGPARHRRQGGSTQGFPCTQAKAGVMPGTPHCILNHQPFSKRSAVVGTFGIDCEELIASPGKQYGFLTNVSGEHASIGNVDNRDAAR
jgi:hypothetical protein